MSSRLDVTTMRHSPRRKRAAEREGVDRAPALASRACRGASFRSACDVAFTRLAVRPRRRGGRRQVEPARRDPRRARSRGGSAHRRRRARGPRRTSGSACVSPTAMRPRSKDTAGNHDHASRDRAARALPAGGSTGRRRSPPRTDGRRAEAAGVFEQLLFRPSPTPAAHALRSSTRSSPAAREESAGLLLIEEPELYLRPQAQRYLYWRSARAHPRREPGHLHDALARVPQRRAAGRARPRRPLARHGYARPPAGAGVGGRGLSCNDRVRTLPAASSSSPARSSSSRA